MLRVQGFSGSDPVRVQALAVYGNSVQGVNDNIVLAGGNDGLVFVDNVVHDNGNANAAVLVSTFYSNDQVMVANNTIAKNVGAGLRLNTYGLPTVGLYNNVLWNNATDLVVTNVNTSAPPLALNNTWLNCSGCNLLASGSANNSSADPKLGATFRLGAGSPASDSTR